MTAGHEACGWALDNVWTCLITAGVKCQPQPKPKAAADAVNHPQHYGGKDNPYEAIKVIHAWGLGFDLGNTVKYIARAGKKDSAKELEDLKKARFYLDHHIADLEAQRA